MSWVRKMIGGLALVSLGAAGCRYLLPERFAVNGPLMNSFLGWGIATPPAAAIGARLQVPAGFSVQLYASGLQHARFLRFTTAGDLLVSQPRLGTVSLLVRESDGRLRETRPLVRGLNLPHGIDWHDGWLYIAETDALGRIRFDPTQRTTSGPFERIVTGIPSSHHWTRTVRVGPDRKLYLSVGSSCNVCEEDDRRRAAIVRYELDGSGEHVVATGLRNSVGFDWQPQTGALYATDNGRDLLGDDFPPCELNQIVDGGFYGFPVANGTRVPDPDFGAGQAARIAASTPPAFSFAAHNAPLGITFLRGAQVPAAWRGAALVALHGSWNRSRKDGYKVVSLHWAADGTITARDFLTGFLQAENVSGRPVDIAEGPDGAIYVSDDYAGAIYRIAVGDSVPTASPPATAAASRPDPLGRLSAAERSTQGARGAAHYVRYDCASCHGERAATPRLLGGLSGRYDLDTLTAFLAAPTPPMPNFNLDAEVRRDLAVHLLATYP
jgi:glucose/arabinose dehydrogenase